MTERIAEIIGISWIVGYLSTGSFLFLGIIPVMYFLPLLLAFCLPVVVLLFVGFIFSMAEEDDEPDDDDAFFSYAYRTMPCNIFYKEYMSWQEEDDDDDGWQADGGDEN